MANTYTLISSVTVGSGGAASISFTSIPATYTDLLIKLSARGDAAATTWQNVRLRFNSDSGSNYTHRTLAGLGTTIATGTQTTVYNRFSYAPYLLVTASIFSNSEYYISNYTSSNNKSMSYDSSAENNSSSVYALAVSGAVWNNSAAISSIEITPDPGGNWVQYSTAYLYGISNA